MNRDGWEMQVLLDEEAAEWFGTAYHPQYGEVTVSLPLQAQGYHLTWEALERAVEEAEAGP